MLKKSTLALLSCSCLFLAGFMVAPAFAQVSTSPSYRLDASVNNNFGGLGTSTNYGLQSSGGESIIGNGSGGSYIIGQGYTAKLNQSMQLTTAASLNLGAVSAGVSNTAPAMLSITTDAAGYTLSAQQDHDLQSGSNFIPSVSGSIDTPVTWSEGITKGLGFSLVSTNANTIPGKWSSGNAYAAMPGIATGFYTRTGFSGGSVDSLNLRFRLDVAQSQPTGTYSNTVTWTGTTTP